MARTALVAVLLAALVAVAASKTLWHQLDNYTFDVRWEGENET